MIPMRDGKRMTTDVYRPKDESKKYPIVFSRTPYNFNFWDVKLGAPRDMTTELEAVRRGYGYVQMNERGHFFSEGSYGILGAPLSDGVDAIEWMSTQPWSNGKVGAIGCSSTAEWQMAVAALGHKGFATMIPQGFGAGVGRVDGFFEQGNWYRGGAVQLLFAAWIYGQQNQVRPMFPPNATREDLINASRMFDLAPQMPPVDWSKALQTLPVKNIITPHFRFEPRVRVSRMLVRINIHKGLKAAKTPAEDSTQWVTNKTSPFSSLATAFSRSTARDRALPTMAV
ncbi:MAG: CocE/NonD family hydrolase [Acidobacteria bacterium]|nr:CocE/NonD family hydrolase [Acidobacteriota bacterium]